jgi:hypothetical protein
MTELLRHFHHHQEDVWRKLSEELGGEFVDGEGWRQDSVCVAHGDWKIVLDFDSHRGHRLDSLYTRFRAPYANDADFRFRIFHQELAHGVGRLLGMQDVTVGDPAFDRAFVVQGSDEGKLKELFSDAGLRAAILAEPHAEVSLRISEESLACDEPGERWELCLEVPGRVEDAARLRALYDTFSRVLHQLCRLSPAYQHETTLGV